MLVIALQWIYAFIICFIYGYGSYHLLSSKLKSANTESPSVYSVVILGLAALTAITGLLSLGIRIGWLANLILVVLGAALTIWQRLEIEAFLRRGLERLRRTHWLVLVTFTALFLVVLIKAAQAPQNYDTGLYHAQVMHWIETYPVVPGLGNLHDRLVFNSSWLLISTLFSFSFLGLPSLHTLGAFLFLVVAAFCLGKFDRLIHGEVSLSNLTVAVVPFLLRRIFSLELSSPGTDMPAALLVWFIVLLAAEKVERGEAKAFDFNYLLILILSLYAITVKLSVLPIALIPIFLFILQSKRFTPLRIVTQALLVIAIFTPWMARSSIQSGYLIYPVSQIDMLDPDWKIPKENVENTQAWISSWAKIATSDRQTVEKMSLTTWIPIWYQKLESLDRQILWGCGLLSVALFAAALALAFTDRRRMRALAPVAFIYIAVGFGIAFWFFGAPAPRFGYPFLGIFIALGLAPFLFIALNRAQKYRRPFGLALIVLLLAYQCVSFIHLTSPTALAAHAILPESYPQVETRLTSIDGHTIAIPANGDQCWYIPFPCTPSLDANVSMRGASFADGFRTVP